MTTLNLALADDVKLSASWKETHVIFYIYCDLVCFIFVCLICVGKVTFQDGRISRKYSQTISFSPSKFSDESLQSSLGMDETTDDQRYSY